jgi:zinc/manganese transport system substrate-binding protein
MARIFSLLLLLLAWHGWSAVAHADLRVVATTADLAAVAKSVGGARVDVVALSLPTQDPHFVDARPHLALDLARADLLIAVGLELEIGWLPTLQSGARNPKIQRGARGYLDCSTVVDKLEVPTTKVDRSMGDIHPGGNPHYMFDPRRVASVAAGIAQRMSELDPTHAAAYQRGAKAFQEQVAQARARWQQAASGLRGAKVLAYHKSLSYLADWLGLKVVEHIEPKPGIPPNPRHITHVLTVARTQGVKLIMQEGWYPRATAEMLAERAGVRLAVIPGGPDFNHGQSYVAFMDAVVSRLVGKGSAK